VTTNIPYQPEYPAGSQAVRPRRSATAQVHPFRRSRSRRRRIQNGTGWGLNGVVVGGDRAFRMRWDGAGDGQSPFAAGLLRVPHGPSPSMGRDIKVQFKAAASMRCTCSTAYGPQDDDKAAGNQHPGLRWFDTSAFVGDASRCEVEFRSDWYQPAAGKWRVANYKVGRTSAAGNCPAWLAANKVSRRRAKAVVGGGSMAGRVACAGRLPPDDSLRRFIYRFSQLSNGIGRPWFGLSR